MTFKPDWVSHPGSTISEILLDKNMSIDQLARRMDQPKQNVQAILTGTSVITPTIANQLGEILGASQSFWLKREDDYRSALSAKLINHNDTLNWLNKIPVKDMIKNGWITNARTSQSRLTELLKFFDTTGIDEWYNRYKDKLMTTSFRTSNTFDSTPESVITWLRRGEQIADKMECGIWNKDAFERALPTAKHLTRCKEPMEFVPALINIFIQCGVAVCVVPAPNGCKASGATFHSNSGHAVIMLSGRYLSDDHFWFSFFHEAGHLVLHGTQETFIEFSGEEIDQKEREANTFAENFLLPTEHKEEFLSLNVKNWKRIPRFARKLGISSGIVVGQLQHKKIIAPNQLNKLKVRYKKDQFIDQA